MFEKVNPMHPDKLADRIAGAIVDLAYTKEENPKVAVEVLIGHKKANVIIETSAQLTHKEVKKIIFRILQTKHVDCNIQIVKQDKHLAANQEGMFRCGDNGIFKGVPQTIEETILFERANEIYEKYGTDGKYILDRENKFIICQSNASTKELKEEYPDAIINPIGDWTGGIDVDSGATNRKLGSDMAQSVTGGGLHGKDLSKADVSINIYLWLKAQKYNKPFELCCAIGDEKIDGRPYSAIVEIARQYIKYVGGFEKFAEWGLVKTYSEDIQDLKGF